jgi:hypothetical protein
MNYDDDKQPEHNSSEIGLIDLGCFEPPEFKKMSRQQLIKRIMELEAYGRNKAFAFLMHIHPTKLPISFSSSIELGEMFGISGGQAKRVIIGFHNLEKHREAVRNATHIYNLDGSVRMEMTDKLRHDMLKAKKR